MRIQPLRGFIRLFEEYLWTVFIIITINGVKLVLEHYPFSGVAGRYPIDARCAVGWVGGGMLHVIRVCRVNKLLSCCVILNAENVF